MAADEIKLLVDVAEGRAQADTLFTNAQIVDVYGQRVVRGRVAVADGAIAGVLFATALFPIPLRRRPSTVRAAILPLVS